MNEINKALVDVNYVFINYSEMMKWLLTQNFEHKKQMTVFNSITEKHMDYLSSIRKRFPQQEFKNPLDTLFSDVR